MSVKDNQAEIVKAVLGHPGALISPSKSSYRRDYPDNMVVFNSNIATKSAGKIWWGDMDATRSEYKLVEARNLVGEDLYIFYELDMRSDNDEEKVVDVLDRAYSYYLVGENGVELVKK